MVKKVLGFGKKIKIPKEKRKSLSARGTGIKKSMKKMWRDDKFLIRK